MPKLYLTNWAWLFHDVAGSIVFGNISYLAIVLNLSKFKNTPSQFLHITHVSCTTILYFILLLKDTQRCGGFTQQQFPGHIECCLE